MLEGRENRDEEDALSRFASSSTEAGYRSSGQERKRSVDWTLAIEEIAKKRRRGDDPEQSILILQIVEMLSDGLARDSRLTD